MGKFPVSLEKETLLFARMKQLGIEESDVVEQFIKGSGKGGQKINKTSSCVYLLHEPTGIEVKCQQTRSQALNRFHARRELCEKLAEIIEGEISKKRQAAEKIKRQKRKRSKRAKQKLLDQKHHRSKVKKSRQRISDD
jgi:protein subunit release factor B